MDDGPPPLTARRFGKRVWLGIAAVMVTLIYLGYNVSLTPAPAQKPPARIVHSDTADPDNSNFRQPALKQPTKVVQNSDTQQLSTAAQDSDVLHTSSKPSSVRDEVKAAAAAIRTNHIPDTFKFSQAVYFHPPPSDHALPFPRVLTAPGQVCSVDGQSRGVLLMLLVLSSYLKEAAVERRAIRNTYGSVVRGHQWPGGKPMAGPIRLVFVLGTPPTPADQKQIGQEAADFGDLLVLDFEDSYRNLTLKVLTGLHWALHVCPQADFVMKADDDVFINLPLLTTFLAERGSNNSLYGTAYLTSPVARSGRWAVSETQYPFASYPVYMSGTAYVMSRDAARTLVKACGRLPLVPVEDAYITGILPQVTGVRRIKCSGFTSFSEGSPQLCEFVRDSRLVGNRVYAADKLSLWTALRFHDRGLC